jgi:hypothetical protein
MALVPAFRMRNCPNFDTYATLIVAGIFSKNS